MRGPVVHEVVAGQRARGGQGRVPVVVVARARLVAPAAPHPMRILVMVIAPPTGES
ncbi:hypothetical protein [Umezawaea sp. Da 62-37]|uniref:hypothetical protein n=1 Tax=Umezawaea sp. Da 62-37 TaxID=3075927 RepID=UPI0028F6D7FD|nr:hypothetical protein [Umezawaea sp. Da 62-37]WNV88259.1 hypothetical protein RM788_08175 [Umezawaea sp. Da 62-37]